MRNYLLLLILVVIVPTVSGCSVIPKGEKKFPTGADRSATDGDIYAKPESIFGSDGLAIFGGKKDRANDGSSGIGVNSFLWRASLDTVSFMPLASADPFGGVIITEWYAADEKPNERFKVNIFILDKQLTSNGIRARVFRQIKTSSGWKDAQTAEGTDRQMEDAILTRARQLRVASLEQ